MRPPQTLNVLDRHGGFTAEITETDPARVMRYGSSYTLWVPGKALKRTTIGALVSFDERSFYQVNNNVTKAIYKVAGYRHPVCCWFDNVTNERIA